MIDNEKYLEWINLSYRNAVPNSGGVKIGLNTDFIQEKLLDSLDGMLFIMELAAVSNVAFPDEGNFEELGFYRVSDLIRYMNANISN